MPSSHMGVSIDPSTLADGTLFGSLDPLAFPQTSGYETTVETGSDPAGPAVLGTSVVTPTPSTSGGTLAAGTYYYRVAALGDKGAETSAEVSAVVASGTTGSVALAWTAAANETGGYEVFGRSQGAEELIGTVAHGASRAFTDTGSVTPDGALPVDITATEAAAGEREGEQAPGPVDAGSQPAELEGDDGSPTEAGI